MANGETAQQDQRPKRKLLDQVRDQCRVLDMARSTEEAYVGWIRRFILFHNKRHPLEMGKAEISAFLTHLAVNGHVAASTQNQALSALLIVCRKVLERDFGWLEDVLRARRPKRMPVVFTPEEAAAILGELQGVRWLMGVLLYGGGLRLEECLRLRVKDVDFDRLQLTIRDAKGEKDRVTFLPSVAIEPLQRRLERARAQHERAMPGGYGGVEQIARKPYLQTTADHFALALAFGRTSSGWGGIRHGFPNSLP